MHIFILFYIINNFVFCFFLKLCKQYFILFCTSTHLYINKKQKKKKRKNTFNKFQCQQTRDIFSAHWRIRNIIMSKKVQKPFNVYYKYLATICSSLGKGG